MCYSRVKNSGEKGELMPKNGKEFRTVRGYQMLKQGSKALTPSMEDYLEMIYRLCLEEGYTRVNNLADELNVQAPSVSRVIRKLSDLGFVKNHKYGIIQLTERGRGTGSYLLARHETVELFLKNLGVGDGLFVDAELIEHHLSRKTVRLLEMLNSFHAAYPEVLQQFEDFRAQSGDTGAANEEQ